MKNNVLFISDGSLTNPIIHSQGLPLLKYLSGKNYRCFLIHFESSHQKKFRKEKIRDIQKSFINEINFIEIPINKYFFLPGIVFNGTRTIAKIISLTITNKIQLYHARSFYPAVICLMIKTIYPKIKYIYDNRGLFIEEEISKGRWTENGLIVRILRVIEKKIIKKADCIVVVSNAFKKHMLDSFINCDEQLIQKVIVIENKTFLNQEPTPLEISKLKAGKRITGVFAGSAAGWQNISEIMTFAKICYESIPNFLLKIVSYHLEEFIKEFQTDHYIFEQSDFIQANSPEVFSHLLTSNFGILLRENNVINNVASPLKFAEYLSAGLPVVVSSGIGDTEDIIRKNSVGVIVESKEYESTVDQLIQLLEDKNIYYRCREIAEKEFDINDSFDKYHQIYSKVVTQMVVM